MQSQERKIQAPVPNLETQAFWDAAARGQADGRQMHRLRRDALSTRARICPFCFSDKTEWQQASGNGTIYTYSVMRRAPIPYAIAYVTLAEGPTMMTNIVDCDLDKHPHRPGREARLQAQRRRPAGADVHPGLIASVASLRWHDSRLGHALRVA